MEDAVKLAVEAEKIFNNSNLLLMTFVDDNISLDKLKSIHNSVKDVKSLQRDFVPQTRYIIEVTDIFDVPSVITALMEHNFKGRHVQVKLLEKYNDGYFGLDPFKLEVKNLPNNISNCDLKQLFPLSADYQFLTPEINSNSKTAIVHFTNVQDAISCFKTVNLVKFHDNILSIKFLRKNVNSDASFTMGAKKRCAEKDSVDFWDYSTDDETITDYVDNRRIETEGNEDINFSSGRDIHHNICTNKRLIDTLIVHNLPSTTEEKEILTLFPSLCRYTFFQKLASKSCIIRFKTALEAVAAYTSCDNVYKSRILQVEFYDNEFDENSFRSPKTARFSRDRSLSQQQKGRIAPNHNNFSFEQQNMKTEHEHHSENQEDSLTLRVKNLPINTTKEDLRQLFPKHCKHQLKIEKTEDCCSAFICFLTSTAASNAYKSMKNKHFRGHVLSIHFKSKPLKVNPFAVKTANNSMTKKSATLSSDTSQNITPPPRSNTYVLRDLNGDFVTEDDVECKSEDNYSDEDDFEVNSDVLEDYESEEEIPGKGLSESILAEDEDLF